ncbi:hypothetical protein GCM10009836_15700 [Pseudonocardia ailaonensis]|uniref:Uncharacterized protein n=1 Tax=Pseudonocardia ailaonensis TaxID=367279 RepID=A0ABN2MTT7_9PSEU
MSEPVSQPQPAASRRPAQKKPAAKKTTSTRPAARKKATTSRKRTTTTRRTTTRRTSTASSLGTVVGAAIAGVIASLVGGLPWWGWVALIVVGLLVGLAFAAAKGRRALATEAPAEAPSTEEPPAG